jgi:hypothetical protein
MDQLGGLQICFSSIAPAEEFDAALIAWSQKCERYGPPHWVSNYPKHDAPRLSEQLVKSLTIKSVSSFRARAHFAQAAKLGVVLSAQSIDAKQ